MNELSKRLYSAVEAPAIQDIRPQISNHPSAASIVLKDGSVIGSCLRQQAYKINKIPPSNYREAGISITAIVGNSYHELACDLINTNGFTMGIQLIAEEHRLYDPELNLSGRCDILAWDHESNEMIGVEVKSVGDWKSKQCMLMPDDTHIMQSMLYLDFYQRNIPSNMSSPKKWYIWYFGRSENWDLKAKKHGSPFTNIWDFHIVLKDIDGDKYPVLYGHGMIKEMPHLRLSKIKARYMFLKKLMETPEEHRVLPPKDYELQYSEQKIAGMYKTNNLQYKKDIAAVEKWIKKGAKPGELGMQMGDFECRFCDWCNKCWNLPVEDETVKAFSLPKCVKEPKSNVESIL